MRTVSADFKTAIKTAGRQLKAYVTDGEDEITEVDDLKSLKITSEGGLCRTVLRQAEAIYFGEHEYLDSYVNIGIGVLLPDTSTEYIDYGGFKVVEVKQDIASGITTAKLYDRMYEGLQKYALEPEYPITTFELVGSICTELGWDIAVESFPNDDISITSNIFENSDVSYRDVLNMIAEASGSIVYFNEDDELDFRQIEDAVLETLTSANLISLKLEPVYGELNSVVLSRQPQEDNIADTDDESIATYGTNEFKIVNNLIMDTDRESYIEAISGELFGIMYYPFEAETEGLGYFEIGDRVKVTDLASTEYEVLIMNISLSMAGGLKETLSAETPEKSTTDYDYAGILGKTIKDTQIIVNKQDGEIQIINSTMETVAIITRQATAPVDPEINNLWFNTSDNAIYIWNGEEWTITGLTIEDLGNYYTKGETNAEIQVVADAIQLSVENLDTRVGDTEVDIDGNAVDIIDVQSDIASLELRADGLEIDVESVGGTNLLKNSVGLKGSIEEWRKFDAEGVIIDADNDGTVVNTSSVVENTESGSAIRIEEQFIIQTASTIIGMPYTFYCRFNKLEGLDLDITGAGETLEITAGDYVDETWAVFKYEFTANSDQTEVKISNVDSGAGAYAILSDMVLKAGIVSGWVQAPNEVYGSNFRFDKDGFSVTSPTDNFKALLDNTKLAMYDTTSGDRTLALFSKDAGLITSLIAQDEFTIQRYENSEKSTRFIPTSTGCMITVNS